MRDLGFRALTSSSPLTCTFAPFKHTLARKGHNLIGDKSCVHQPHLSPRRDVSPRTNAR